LRARREGRGLLLWPGLDLSLAKRDRMKKIHRFMKRSDSRTPRYLSAHEAEEGFCFSPFVVGGGKGIEEDMLWLICVKELKPG
jgi:hypothetical protein